MKNETNENFRLRDGKLISDEHRAPVDLPPGAGEGETWILAPLASGSAPEGGNGGPYYLIGKRKLGQVRIDKTGRGYGYGFISGAQTRIELHPVEVMGKVETMGFIARPKKYDAPAPLETKADYETWLGLKFTAAMNAEAWRRGLKWRGAGSKQAAASVRARWIEIGKNGKSGKECPCVEFPAPPPPVEIETPAPAPGTVEVMKAEIAELRETMKAEIAELKARIAMLEFQP